MKVATKHDIEAILNWCKKYEKEAREKHKTKLINGDEETVWSSYHFGYAEGIEFCLDLFNKAIWNDEQLKSEQNKVAVEKLEELLNEYSVEYHLCDSAGGKYKCSIDAVNDIFIKEQIKELKGESDD